MGAACCTDEEDAAESGTRRVEYVKVKALSLDAAALEISTTTSVTTSAPPSPQQVCKRPATPLTEEQREQLRQRLVTFMRAAIKGRPVRMLVPREDPQQDESATREIPATLRLEPDYSRLLFSAKEESIWCPVARITDIYDWHSDGRAAFPQEILEALFADDPDLILKVEFTAPGGDPQSVFFLEASCQARDDFLQSMKALCAKAKRKEASALGSDVVQFNAAEIACHSPRRN